MPKYIVTTNNKHSQEFADLEVALNFIAESVDTDHEMAIIKKAIVIPAFKIEFALDEIEAIVTDYDSDWSIGENDAQTWFVRDVLKIDLSFDWDVILDGGLMIISLTQ